MMQSLLGTAQLSSPRSFLVSRKELRSLKGHSTKEKNVYILDYGAGNVRSVENAIKRVGFNYKKINHPSEILQADKLIFPGVGAFQQAMTTVKDKNYVKYLKEYIQLLFDGSEENGGVEGLGVVPGCVTKFKPAIGLPVPHIGWNTLKNRLNNDILKGIEHDYCYFVHSFKASLTDSNSDWAIASTMYGEEFVSMIGKGNVFATQFHPEKSGLVGLKLLQFFLNGDYLDRGQKACESKNGSVASKGLGKRIIACLDVRSNDNGNLVVTKGDQYDVRDNTKDVRNLGDPVKMAERYYLEGADEITFLNITGYRDCPLSNAPMLQVLQQASQKVFVPLTVGGGIRAFTDSNGQQHSALDVASEYFRSGADKVSIGSDAVKIAEEFYKLKKKTGLSSIEVISWNYGAQAVVVSIDPRRVYVKSPSCTRHSTIKSSKKGPNGEEYVWWQCTINGGREARDISALELARAVEELGAGEILLNCIDSDGQGHGFDCELIDQVSKGVNIPVIASSGAGKTSHFIDVFSKTEASAALAAGIFHRQEVCITEIKDTMDSKCIPVRVIK